MAAGLRKISRGPPGEGAVRKLFFSRTLFFHSGDQKKCIWTKKNFWTHTTLYLPDLEKFRQFTSQGIALRAVGYIYKGEGVV